MLLCDKVATSVEHCPAKSFFPKTKRNNLITVPSCYIHNEKTSLDDEYVRDLILISKDNNIVAEEHFKDKGIQSLQRSAGLFNELTKNPKRLNFIEGDDNSQNLAFQVDKNRFDKVIEKLLMAYFILPSIKLGILSLQLLLKTSLQKI